MEHAVIDAGRCDRSPGCPVRRACQSEAVFRVDGGPHAGSWAIDDDLCSACGICLRACPMGAVSMSDEQG